MLPIKAQRIGKEVPPILKPIEFGKNICRMKYPTTEPIKPTPILAKQPNGFAPVMAPATAPHMAAIINIKRMFNIKIIPLKSYYLRIWFILLYFYLIT